MDGTIHPLRAPASPRLVGGADGAADTPPSAAPTFTDGDVQALRDALSAYLGPSRPENAYANLVAAARRCGCPVGEPVIGWAGQFLKAWSQPVAAAAVVELVGRITTTNSLERVTEEPRRWAIDSDNGAA